MSRARDIRPALGTAAEPGRFRRAVEGAAVALHRRRWADARWSFLYGRDTRYAAAAENGPVAEAARRGRRERPPTEVQGPLIQPPAWTWEVPLYFWFGGIASGAALAAAGCDLSGDHRSARTARALALGAALPCGPLLISDLGRPERFLNMLRILKPRSPMSTGAWSLSLFSSLAGAAVLADRLDRARPARWLGVASAACATYFGSYTGVLLSVTAVPVWSRSRLLLGPIFAATATATGAAATRLALAGAGLPARHPTREAVGRVETGAIAAELALSALNERRLGAAGRAVRTGRAGLLFRAAKAAVATGLALRAGRRGPLSQHGASALYLVGGLLFRYGWLEAGRASALDHEAVAREARASRAGSAGAG